MPDLSNEGIAPVLLLNAMSLSLDLPDSDYVWMQFSGVWARERHIIERKLEQGIQAVGSIRGNSHTSITVYCVETAV